MRNLVRRLICDWCRECTFLYSSLLPCHLHSLSCLPPSVGPGCVLCPRIDPLRFLAECRRRRLNQGLVVALDFFSLSDKACFCVMLFLDPTFLVLEISTRHAADTMRTSPYLYTGGVGSITRRTHALRAKTDGNFRKIQLNF